MAEKRKAAAESEEPDAAVESGARKRRRAATGEDRAKAPAPEDGGDGEPTRGDVARRLLELYQRCLRAERVMTYDKDEKKWVLSDEWKLDARGAAMALEQLSELMGFGAQDTETGAVLRLSEEAAELGE